MRSIHTLESLLCSLYNMFVQKIYEEIRQVLFSPKKFWETVKEGRVSTKETLRFALILPTIPPVFSFVGLLMFRMNVLRQIGMWRGIAVFIILSYVMFVALPFIMGYIIEAVATTLGGKEVRKGWTVAVYSSTPFWIASAINIFPPLFPLSLTGAIYTITLLFTAGNRVFDIPVDKQPTFTFATASIWLILTFIFSAFLGAISLGEIVVGVPVRL